MRIWPASLSAKGQTKGSWAGVVCPAGCIDKAGRVVPSLPFLIGAIKTNKLCIKESLTI